jgi:hypothetical protein
MHQLPFGAQMTDKLFRLAEKTPPVPRGECVRALEFAPLSLAVPGKAGWLLTFRPPSYAKPERVFVVDGVSFYLSEVIEPLLRGQVLDWDSNRGVVVRAA